MTLNVSVFVALVAVVGVSCASASAAVDGDQDVSPASYARWLAHNTTYGVMSTISHINGFPFGNIFSFADGPVNKSTGHLYFYASPIDASMVDFQWSKKGSFTVTQEDTGTCALDPEDPTCARLVFSGTMRNCTEAEKPFAREALFTRHPEMKDWSPTTFHHFEFLTMDLVQVWMVNHYGGAAIIDPKDYYSATPQKGNTVALKTMKLHHE
eukprot:m.16283 g.16283  ORF g.16283 m.16283 type:complete len:211 (+) comp7981_c0_seq1:140-772(+)